MKTDPPEVHRLMRGAIKSFNKQDPTDQMSFSIPMKVSLSCQGEESWYGGFTSLPTSTVFDALIQFAKENLDEARGFAEDIDDKITRIRTLAMITRVALGKAGLRVKEQGSRPKD